MRMQNFMELPSGEIFWTSASLTIPQKLTNLYIRIICWLTGDDYEKHELCNTSRGFTLPFHGQNIRTDGFYIYHDLADDIEVYDLTDGKFIELLVGKSTLPYKEVAAINTDKVQQGVCYNFETSKYEFVVFGTKGKRNIEIYCINPTVMRSFISYKDLKKWYWKSWEAEGIQYNLKGELEIGISVKTIFGAILNYTHKV